MVHGVLAVNGTHLLGLNSISYAGDYFAYLLPFTMVSSANKWTCDWIFSGKSFIYSKTNICPRSGLVDT